MMVHSVPRTAALDRLGLGVVAVAFSATFFILGGGRLAAAEPTQTVLDDVHAMVVGTGTGKGNDALVLGFSYPTAKSLTKIEYVPKSLSVANDGSFTLMYKYSYRDSDNDPQDFQLRFAFTAKGKLTDVRELAGKHSSFWPPFFTATVFLELAKEAVRQDKDLKNEPLGKALLAVKSPVEFMTILMNTKAGK